MQLTLLLLGIHTSKVLSIVTAALILQGCGGGSDGSATEPSNPGATSPTAPDPSGLWVKSDNGEGLAAYKMRLSTVSTERMSVAFDAAPTPENSGSTYSTTYTVEESVDEHDIVKYNGSLLAVAPSRTACCFILEDTANEDFADIMPPEPGNASIKLFITDPDAGSADYQAAIALPEDLTAEGLYLDGDRLHSLLSSSWWGVFGSRHIEPGYWEDQQVVLNTHDVSSPGEPALTSSIEIEGGLVSSRRNGDNIYVVSRHTPALEGLIPYPANEEEALNNENVLATVSGEDILPQILVDGERFSDLSLDDCYRQDPEHPLAAVISGDPVITTMLKVSSSTGDIAQAACAMESIDGISLGERYIALTLVRWDNSSDETLIHMLTVDELEYAGSESVSGALYTGGNADFRINEFEDVLRLVTTRWTDDPEDSLQHVLYTLAPSEEGTELEVLGTLGDTEESRIGKVNEDLYGVRFKGPRAYLVTFERVDPLYVVDLADPKAPRMLGELEVTGFSDLLHEVSADLLLGLGSSENLLPKLELFDISDVSAPVSRSLIELAPGWDWAYSPAQYNRYALTYLVGEAVDRLTVPYSAQRQTEGEYEQIDRIALFEISGKSDAKSAQISPVGEVTLQPGNVSGDTRVILDGAALYVIAYTDMLAGFWSNPEALQAFTE